MLKNTMKIGIDISQAVYRGSGVGRFTIGLIDCILKYEKNHDWVFFFSSLRNQLDYEIKLKIKNKGFQIYDYPFPPTVLSFLWNKYHKFKIDHFLKNLDWFISSDWTEPPSSFKKATIVHDLVYKRFPETLDPLIVKTQDKKLQHVRAESKIIFADSISTKKDLVNFLNIREDKIVVNYPGVNVLRTKKEFDVATLKKFNINKQYIISVGKIEPRKNIQRLIDSFINLDIRNLELIIVGEYGWGPNIKSSKNIRYLGYIQDAELFSLYKSSLFFIYPSLWEGFGYPVIEAMASATAVATSNTSSLKEISQQSTLLFNPYKISEIQETIKKLVYDEPLRKELVKKGLITYRQFTWKNYYNTLIQKLEFFK